VSYNATSNIVLFENKSSFIYLEKNVLAFYNVVVVNSKVVHVGLALGVNTPIVSYYARAVNIYYATGSIVRFENKNIFYYTNIFSSTWRKTFYVYGLLERWHCSCQLKSRRIGSRSQSYDRELQHQRCKN
jgi:hypothetical protein